MLRQNWVGRLGFFPQLKRTFLAVIMLKQHRTEKETGIPDYICELRSLCTFNVFSPIFVIIFGKCRKKVFSRGFGGGLRGSVGLNMPIFFSRLNVHSPAPSK